MFAYTNRRGVAYYVHEARTKTGARRYVVKRTSDGAMAELPPGLEIVENVNGQVSVRAARPRTILPLEESLVEEALVGHGRSTYRAEVKDRYIVIHAPDHDVHKMAELFDPGRAMDEFGFGPALDKMIREKVGDAAWEEYRRESKARAARDMERRMRYSPVLRFRLDEAEERRFSVERMCYRGEGGWLWLTDGMTLRAACERYVPLLGTDEMFEQF